MHDASPSLNKTLFAVHLPILLQGLPNIAVPAYLGVANDVSCSGLGARRLVAWMAHVGVKLVE